MYQLLTVIYGTASAPYLANRIRQLANDEGPDFLLAKIIVEQNLYVDDVFFGANTVNIALRTRDELIQLMQRGGFILHKWSANDARLFQSGDVPEASVNFDLPKNSEEHCILGLNWDPQRDAFYFRKTSMPHTAPTKRLVLSIISRLYDSLGWVTPVIITAKLLMQELWIRKIDWDATIPEDLRKQWQAYSSSLSLLSEVAIPRWVGLENLN